ncbi:uncharacterized protein THITE_2126926 [Thermothielavioides terrestris NRRL 8126]|uniref:Uncharacterized protein n=1 Tax=Thermothielavioides terrestris (strain ATCC 38088 / NRRL 8126) TaxID=578455 RepID=G2QV08_THETT|nr:uncharacterized protein THITE_2126926 [Thermothielavioides terrestris NRRL 8126]AEO64606.1 hypothetical protein THITE_2126926 [Thermothielavioides terrestris NRRL 8126]
MTGTLCTIMMKAQTAAIVLVAIAPDVAVNHALQSQAPAPTTCRDRGTPTLLKLEAKQCQSAGHGTDSSVSSTVMLRRHMPPRVPQSAATGNRWMRAASAYEGQLEEQQPARHRPHGDMRPDTANDEGNADNPGFAPTRTPIHLVRDLAELSRPQPRGDTSRGTTIVPGCPSSTKPRPWATWPNTSHIAKCESSRFTGQSDHLNAQDNEATLAANQRTLDHLIRAIDFLEAKLRTGTNMLQETEWRLAGCDVQVAIFQAGLQRMGPSLSKPVEWLGELFPQLRALWYGTLYSVYQLIETPRLSEGQRPYRRGQDLDAFAQLPEQLLAARTQSLRLARLHRQALNHFRQAWEQGLQVREQRLRLHCLRKVVRLVLLGGGTPDLIARLLNGPTGQ